MRRSAVAFAAHGAVPERVPQALAAAYIALMPLSLTPFPWNIQWSDVVFSALFIAVIISIDLRRLRLHALDLLIVLYILAPLPSFAQTGDVSLSSIQYVKHLYLALVYVVFAVLTDGASFRRKLGTWCAFLASLLAGLSVLAAVVYYAWNVEVAQLGLVMPLPYLGDVYRAYGLFHSAEYFANFLTFVFPMLLGLAFGQGSGPEQSRSATWRAATMTVVLAAVSTFAHSVAGLLVSGLVYLWGLCARPGLWTVRIIAAVLVVTLLVALNVMLVVAVRDVTYHVGRNPAIPPPGYLHGFQDERGAPTVSVSVSYNLISYFLLKKIAWEAFWRAPATGVGLGQFPEETDRAYREGALREEYRSITPHSTWFGTLAETGLLGGVSLALLWGGVMFAGIKGLAVGHEDAWVRRAVFAGVVGLLVNSINVEIMHFRFLWVGLALLRSTTTDLGATGGDHVARA